MTKRHLGNEINVKILEKGDVFGAIELIAKSRRTVTVVAKTDMETGMMYREDFINTLEKLTPEVSNVIKKLMRKLSSAYRLNSELVFLTVDMLDTKRAIKSLNTEKLKENLNQIPESFQTLFISLENSLKNIIRNSYTLSNQLDKSATKVDELFKQSFGQNL